MFPTTSLLLGSSLLWSALPLSDAPARTRQEYAEGVVVKAFDCLKPEVTRKLADDFFMVVENQRSFELLIREIESYRLFYGLQHLFENGDRRVAVSNAFWQATPEDEEDLPDAVLVSRFVLMHADLEEEAARAFTLRSDAMRLERIFDYILGPSA